MLLYIMYYSMLVCVMAWFSVAVLIVVPHGAKMLEKVTDGDGAEPPPPFFLLSLCQRFQHRLDGRQLGPDLQRACGMAME